MGTRACIIIEGYPIKLFRHWDGYPEGEHGVLATLLPQVSLFWRERGYEPNMLMAWITEQQRKGHKDMLGFRLMTQYPSDIEFLYRITKKGQVEVRHCTSAFWDKPVLYNTKKRGVYDRINYSE